MRVNCDKRNCHFKYYIKNIDTYYKPAVSKTNITCNKTLLNWLKRREKAMKTEHLIQYVVASGSINRLTLKKCLERKTFWIKQSMKTKSENNKPEFIIDHHQQKCLITFMPGNDVHLVPFL